MNAITLRGAKAPKPYPQRLVEYEKEKQAIAQAAVSSQEYEARIKELARRWQI